MARYIIPGFRKIETSGGGGEGGTTNYNDLTNKPSINNVPLVGNLNTVNLKLTDTTLTEEGVPAEAKTVGSKLNELEGKYAKKDLYDDTTINVGRKAGTEIGRNSTAEGYSTTASGYFSHAEGSMTNASGKYSHTEGFDTTASEGCSHAEGYGTTASGEYSHAEGKGTNASSDLQHIQGKYNIKDTEGKYAHIVGNGTSDTARSNAHTVDWEGNAWYAGDVFNGNGVSLDGLNTNMSDVWNNSVTYGVNSYCIYNNKLWKCKVQHTNQPPTEGTYWTACTISGEISELNSNLAIETLSKDSITTTGYVLTHYFKEASKLLNIVIFRTTLECDAMSQKSWYKLLQLPSNIFPKNNIEIICISTNGVNVSIAINEEGELSVYPRGNILKNDVVSFNVVYTI